MVRKIVVRTANIEGAAATYYDMIDNLDFMIFQNMFGASFSGAGIEYEIGRAISQLTVSSERLSGSGGAVQFSQTFTSGVTPTAAIKTAWTTFRQSLTGTYTTFTWSSSNGSSKIVTDSVKVQQIADALRTATTGTNFSVTIGADTWRVVTNCVAGTVTADSVEFTNDTACACGGSGKYTIRPFINNSNWGGSNQSTCDAPTQTITITFA